MLLEINNIHDFNNKELRKDNTMKHHTYKTSGTCSVEINFDIEDNKIHTLEFTGGCNGNLKGIRALVKGMKVDDVIDRLSGIQCGFKPTSCPDQIAKALIKYKNK